MRTDRFSKTIALVSVMRRSQSASEQPKLAKPSSLCPRLKGVNMRRRAWCLYERLPYHVSVLAHGDGSRCGVSASSTLLQVDGEIAPSGQPRGSHVEHAREIVIRTHLASTMTPANIDP